jgi:cell wall hydrolase
LIAVAIVLAIPPGRTGYRAPAQPSSSPGFRAHLLASPFGTIHAATFRFSRPIGTDMPGSPGLHLAAYTRDRDSALGLFRSFKSPAYEGKEESYREFPEINRSLKGARLVPRVRPDFGSQLSATVEGKIVEGGLSAASLSSGTPAGGNDEAIPDRKGALNVSTARDDVDLIYPDPPADETTEAVDEGSPVIRMALIYFTSAPPDLMAGTVEPWPGEAVGPTWREPGDLPMAPHAPSARPSNETIAQKGEVTGAGRRPMSPAERLALTGAARARHEKCLADAVYFEARGEPVRGQMAVAQVVINRVFSGYYPNNVCGVVYQNTHRHRRLRCQFTFACDGIPERINEPQAWERAKRIARDALDGNFWLNDVGKATHYHARWVHPWWVREMRRLDRIGVHTFYRPRKWGDGAGSPVWGDASGKLENL